MSLGDESPSVLVHCPLPPSAPPPVDRYGLELTLNVWHLSAAAVVVGSF